MSQKTTIQKGVLRHLGVKQTPPKLKGAFGPFKARPEALPRADWRTTDYRHLGVETRDANGFAACTGYTGAALVEAHRAIHKLPKVTLSGMFAYALINGGKDQGALPAELMRVLQDVGVVRDELWGKDQLILPQLNDTLREDAAKHRLADAYQCRSFDDLATALILEGPCYVALSVGHNCGRLEADGYLPLPERSCGGHSFLVLGLLNLRGSWSLLLQNVVWGRTWGFDGGYCLLSETCFQRCFIDGYAARLLHKPVEVVKEAPVEVVTPVKKEEVVTAPPVEQHNPVEAVLKPMRNSIIEELIKKEDKGVVKKDDKGATKKDDKRAAKTVKTPNEKPAPQGAELTPDDPVSQGEKHVE